MAFSDVGYLVIKNVLNKNEVMSYRNTLDEYLMKNKSLKINGAKIIPGWSGITPGLGILNELHKDKRILDELSKVFGPNKYRFLGHSDLHQNKDTNWHRDIKDLSRGGCDLDIWDKNCFILKVCFLLQDHTDNDFGLWFQPGTHLSGKLKSDPIHVYSDSTDMIIFDQRILHKGQCVEPFYREVYKQNRYLLTFGYGLLNKYSDFHEAGARKRQNQQREIMEL